MINISYKQYIKSNAWKRLRKAALERDGHICRLCKKNKATDCHHIIYPIHFQNDCLNNIISCCKECHEKEDNIIGYTKFGVIRQTLIYHECIICKKILNELELDMENGKWICNQCESLKKGDFEDGN